MKQLRNEINNVEITKDNLAATLSKIKNNLTNKGIINDICKFCKSDSCKGIMC